MNRIVITLDQNGQFDGVASDEPIEFFVYDPNCKSEPIYHYQSVAIGPQEVRKILKDHPIGYGGEDMLVDYKGSRPKLEAIKS